MRKITVFGTALTFLLSLSIDANAISLRLSGLNIRVRLDDAQAVYASNSKGASQLIAEVGQRIADGAIVTQVGVPSMMPDGRVVFGAETQPEDRSLKPYWNIYVGDADAVSSRRMMTPLSPSMFKPGCVPAMRGDPYPVADDDGNIAFTSAQEHGNDALFYYSHGTLQCPAMAGAKTKQGHVIQVLGFGSPQMGNIGHVVFIAFLADKAAAPPSMHREALLIASPGGGIAELALEGEYGPNHTLYERPFGLPAAVASAHGTIAAFTTKTPSGAALFVYKDQSMERVLPAGTLTQLGPVSYLSPGRPGLMADGTTAVLAGCARMPAVFRLVRQRLDLRLERGQITPLGTELDALGDPVLTASGAMFIGATDTDGHEKLYVLSSDDAFYEIGNPKFLYRIAMAKPHDHSIFTGTLTVNQHGDFAYLGSK
jgi:hypothetical protein